MKLLAIGTNAKTAKSDKTADGYLTAIMYLAPHDLAGRTVCPFATVAGCAAACLNTAGRGAFNNVQAARIRKTRWYHDNRATFMAQLTKDIGAAKRKAARAGKRLAVRLNGTSDIQWENEATADHDNVMAAHPEVTFYDYTKTPSRKNLPSNYSLTFSYSAASEKYAAIAGNVMQTRPDVNVAVVFRKELPDTFQGRRVVSGDDDDLRFLDPENVVVGLTAKGAAKHDTSGFVQA